MDRPEGSRRHERLTWEDVDKLVDVLIPQIRAVGLFTGMIMITRGGVIPGGMLAEALGIQHLLTAAVDFPAVQTQGAPGLLAWPQFLQFPEASLLANRRILIVDDVWGSGRTSISVRERVISAGATGMTCVLHYNPYRSLFTHERPDFYGASTDAYIVYPWEVDRGTRGIALPDMN
ncbi:MAG: phosphoribosyltransferase [Chloroflexi bacterium]|jgi:hypoxanthine phosphoribosyltransferase|uniref:phosphoribosyltransferase n=1 Tax=Candidatus Flexifilum breve TaxID=3140694 RepID=UPI0031347833|nr:phosphoribosyltransferase [Chloroflexota bacterium]